MSINIALNQDYDKATVQLSILGYVRAAIHLLQHDKPKRLQDSPYPWTQPFYENINQMLSDKEPAEELDENNQK